MSKIHDNKLTQNICVSFKYSLSEKSPVFVYFLKHSKKPKRPNKPDLHIKKCVCVLKIGFIFKAY